MIKSENFEFINARPIWVLGKRLEMNITMSAVARLDADIRSACLHLAASSSYIVLVNGKLIAHGPARCAHGYYRVDEFELDKYLSDGENYVAVRAVGYNINAFSYLNAPSFLCAEIVSGNDVLAYTDKAGKGFKYYQTGERVSRVQKYSFQRTFVETYKLGKDAFAYEYSDIDTPLCDIELSSAGKFITRALPYGDYETLLPHVFGRGKVSYSKKDEYFHDRCIKNISDKLLGFKEDEIEDASYIDLGDMDFTKIEAYSADISEINVPAETYVALEFERDFAGIFTFELETDGGVLYFTFDEILSDNEREIDEFRMECSNIVKWTCEKGKYRITCAEPYTLKYLRITAKGGNMKLRDLCMRKVAFPSSKITKKLATDDENIKLLFDAAVETFAANTVDIYMDCPSRERAGWLCDSFFTSRVEHVLTGKSEVERAFLENFIISEDLGPLPAGMLPMCYPSDHYDGSFIPNWAMWYVVELGEYLDRSGDRELIDLAKEKVYALLKYFKGFENEYGLLEKLESWVFVEWSQANKLVQDVNFPTNMLYSKFKSVISELYGDKTLADEADALRATIASMSMTDSGFFCDNAIRKDGKLELSGERTEACQYYAFFFGIATEKTHAQLLDTLLCDFGFERRKNNKHPEIYFANAFIGNYMRLDIMERLGKHDLLLKNIKEYFTYMAETTGTLWENETSYASCNHGFASLVAYWLDKVGLCK